MVSDMTNEEIVKALRCISTEGIVATDCKGCPFYAREQLDPKLAEELGIIGQGEWYSCDCNAVGFAAADLIENQQNHIRALLQANDALRPAWIPVTERLLEDGQDVLCWYEYFRYGAMLATYGIGYQYFGNWGGEVSHGTHARVLAWMPLPPTPEED